MSQNFDWDKFSKLIKKVIDFKTKTSYTYVNADAWEEVLYFSLKKMGENPDWNMGSHEKGADIKTKKFAISAKSGKIQEDKLILSSYRLTRYTAINQMANFIDDEQNYDFYLCCARQETETGGRKYVVFKIPADIFEAKKVNWEKLVKKDGEYVGYYCDTPKGVHAEIRKKMSNQLWLNVPLTLCEKILEIDYSQEEIGSEFDKIFE